MKIEYRRVTRRIELGEYTPELSGAWIDVWVNVSREVMLRMLNVSAETPDEDFYGLLVELWGAEAWPIEDIRELRAHCAEHDPQLWPWVVKRSWDAVIEYQGLAKKK